MEEIKKYYTVTDTIDTLFTILIHHKTAKDVTLFFEDQLEKAKNIHHVIKKKKVNQRLYSFLEYIKHKYEENDIIHSIFLLDDTVIFYPLQKKEIETAHLYNMKNIYIQVDTYFHIDFLIDFFYNFDFIYAIELFKYDILISQLNKYKEKKIDSFKNTQESKLLEEIDTLRKTYKDILFIHGISSFFSKIPSFPNIIIVKKKLSKEELYELYLQNKMKQNHVLLEKRLQDMQNEKTNLDLYVFGKLKYEIKDAIEAYSIKELYIDSVKLQKLKTFISNDFLNFTIIPIYSIEKGDIAELFIRDYHGLLGIKYY